MLKRGIKQNTLPLWEEIKPHFLFQENKKAFEKCSKMRKFLLTSVKMQCLLSPLTERVKRKKKRKWH